jgi:ubiquinone/menaquinone biosynthesis C-methylase UbiE
MTTGQTSFTPALGVSWASPAYDVAIRMLTRERRWRRALLKQIAAQPNDRIADIGCGTGSQAILIKRNSPWASVYGLDPDPDILVRAEAKASRAGAGVHFMHAMPAEMAGRLAAIRPNKIVSSLVFHQVPLGGKRELLAAMFAGLPPGGRLHIADYGWQRTPAMRLGFRIVQALDGVANTQPNAEGCMPALLEDAGFTHVAETAVIPTVTGSISLYRGTKP